MMNHLHLALAAAVLLVAGTLCADIARADQPSYLLLQPPSPSMHHGRYDAYGGDGFAVDAPSYSYGWFGAPPRRHFSRQYGYYRYYTQWTYR